MAAAGLSHLVLDLLVGVMPLPLLWPLARTECRLPFGLLPSAGAIRLFNPYLYRNLLIEMGVLVPVVLGIVLARRGYGWRRAIACVCAALPFLIWAAGLSR